MAQASLTSNDCQSDALMKSRSTHLVTDSTEIDDLMLDVDILLFQERYKTQLEGIESGDSADAKNKVLSQEIGHQMT